MVKIRELHGTEVESVVFEGVNIQYLHLVETGEWLAQVTNATWVRVQMGDEYVSAYHKFVEEGEE